MFPSQHLIGGRAASPDKLCYVNWLFSTSQSILRVTFMFCLLYLSSESHKTINFDKRVYSAYLLHPDCCFVGFTVCKHFLLFNAEVRHFVEQCCFKLLMITIILTPLKIQGRIPNTNYLYIITRFNITIFF